MASNPERNQLDPQQTKRASNLKKGGLVAIIGASAAAMLVQFTAKEESGRTVAVHVQPDNTIQITNLSGRQYLQTYLDIAGVATACDGLTKSVSPLIKPGAKFTEQQCASMLSDALAIHAKAVMACTPWNTTTQVYQIVGSVSFDYNTGSWCKSSAAKAVKAGNLPAAGDAILAWDKARVKGVLRPVKGLTMRRNRERETFMTGLTPFKTPANLADRLRAFQ